MKPEFLPLFLFTSYYFTKWDRYYETPCMCCVENDIITNPFLLLHLNLLLLF